MEMLVHREINGKPHFYYLVLTSLQLKISQVISGYSAKSLNLFEEFEKWNSTRGLTYHEIPDPSHFGITIQLNGFYYINHIRFRLYDQDLRYYSHHVEVDVDGYWHRVIDHSQLPYRSWQYLYFPSRILRYIRIVGAKNTVNWPFNLIYV
jgi:BTB/POZ domain-containing protein 9